jgi:LmbE family N-acetylglucosaminyl deacetylase
MDTHTVNKAAEKKSARDILFIGTDADERLPLKNRPNEAIFIGAHADDIEIGAWSAAYKLIANKWKVFFIVMTVDSDANERLSEAVEAAKFLSKDIEIFFLKETDGLLACNKQTVSKLRSLISSQKINARVVFCHSKADSHNDHRAVNEIAISSFRESVIIEYPVINSLIKSDFKPNIFSAITDEIIKSQNLALSRHKSQTSRISTYKIYKYREESSQLGKKIYVDKFKATLQAGYSENQLAVLMDTIDDIPTHKLLGRIIRDGLVAISGGTIFRKNRTIDHSIMSCGKSVSSLLRTYMQTIVGMKEVIEVPATDPNIHEFAEESSILVIDGAISNSFAREYYDHFVGLNYKIDYEIPNYQNQCILDVSLKMPSKIYPKYGVDDFGKKKIIEDIGILTFMKNPLNTDKWLIGCMGVHSIGTMGCFRALMEDALASLISSKLEESLGAGQSGIQVLVGYAPGGEPRFLPRSWRRI